MKCRELTTHKCIQHVVGTYFAISELVVGELTPWASCWTKVDWGIGLLHHLIVPWHKVGMEVCFQYAFDRLGFLFQILERQTCTHIVCMYNLYVCSVCWENRILLFFVAPCKPKYTIINTCEFYFEQIDCAICEKLNPWNFHAVLYVYMYAHTHLKLRTTSH